MKKIKKIIPIIIAFIIGISTTVTATTVFNSKDITYSSSSTSKTNVKDSLDELYTKANTPWKCATGYYCYTTFCPTGYTHGTNSDGYPICTGTKAISTVKVGDYISLTPTSTSYTISASLTGYTYDQTINPSELKLWRVIKKNTDGTVDVVSQYVSSTKVGFRGQVGFLKFVGTLNTIAAQYTNTKYVSKTRNMGYSNQIETCTSLSSCPSDKGYETDNSLVQTSLGTLVGTTMSGSGQSYWVASRLVTTGIVSYSGRQIRDTGDMNNYYSLYDERGSETSISNGIRPILTLKADVLIKSGSGTSSSPYQFQ